MSLRPRAGERRKDYKPAVDAEEARRKREDNLIEIRKSKRDESLTKKRREGMLIGSHPASLIQVDSLSSLATAVHSDDPQIQLSATIQFRKYLSIEKTPPIQEVINAGVVPRLVEFLSRHDFHQLQFEAAWALTNIASGSQDQTLTVMNYGAVPHFVQLLSSPSADAREQAVWALGNIAGDSTKCRDFVLQHGALMPLLALINDSANLSLLRNSTWTLSNFVRGKPPPNPDVVEPALSALAKLINSSDDEVLIDACWAISYISDGTNDRIQAVIDAGACPRLVNLLSWYPSHMVLVPALRCVGNIVTGDDVQTQYMINISVLPYLLQLMGNSRKSIKKETCWAISNITAGTKEQIQAVIDANLIPPLVDLLANGEYDVKKEAAWAISNATAGGTHEQIIYVVSQGSVRPLCDILNCHEVGIVGVALEALDNMLRIGEVEKEAGKTELNVVAKMVEDAEGLDKIEKLQSHDSSKIYEKATRILETYWDAELEEEQGELVPTPQAGFNFGF